MDVSFLESESQLSLLEENSEILEDKAELIISWMSGEEESPEENVKKQGAKSEKTKTPRSLEEKMKDDLAFLRSVVEDQEIPDEDLIAGTSTVGLIASSVDVFLFKDRVHVRTATGNIEASIFSFKEAGDNRLQILFANGSIFEMYTDSKERFKKFVEKHSTSIPFSIATLLELQGDVNLFRCFTFAVEEFWKKCEWPLKWGWSQEDLKIYLYGSFIYSMTVDVRLIGSNSEEIDSGLKIMRELFGIIEGDEESWVADWIPDSLRNLNSSAFASLFKESKAMEKTTKSITSAFDSFKKFPWGKKSGTPSSESQSQAELSLASVSAKTSQLSVSLRKSMEKGLRLDYFPPPASSKRVRKSVNILLAQARVDKLEERLRSLFNQIKKKNSGASSLPEKLEGMALFFYDYDESLSSLFNLFKNDPFLEELKSQGLRIFTAHSQTHHPIPGGLTSLQLFLWTGGSMLGEKYSLGSGGSGSISSERGSGTDAGRAGRALSISSSLSHRDDGDEFDEDDTDIISQHSLKLDI